MCRPKINNQAVTQVTDFEASWVRIFNLRALAYRDAGGRPRLERRSTPTRMQVVDRVWTATGILGGLFPTPPYHLRPVGVPSRRIQDILSIAATGVLPSRRIPDFLSINEGREKSWRDLFRAADTWSGKPGSNRRPQPWQGCALPTELFPRIGTLPQRPYCNRRHLGVNNIRQSIASGKPCFIQSFLSFGQALIRY